MKKLDLIAVPILVDGDKLIRHFETIDVPLKRYFILDNSMGKDFSVDQAIKEIINWKPEHIDEVVVCSLPQNVGFSGAINLIIRQNTDCKHWIVTGFDWWVKPGEWQKLLKRIDIIPFGATLATGNDQMCGIVFNPALLKRVGYFDENFFPGYYEDNDYRYRLKLTNTSLASIPLEYEHATSSTLNSSEKFKTKNKISFQENYNYYMKKWGGPPGLEVYLTPFNKNYPIDYWAYDPTRSEKLKWV